MGTTCKGSAPLAVIDALNRDKDIRPRVINMSFARDFKEKPSNDPCGKLDGRWRLSDLTDRVDKLELTVGELTTSVNNSCDAFRQILNIAEELSVVAVAGAGNCFSNCEAWTVDNTTKPVTWTRHMNAVSAFSLPAGFDTVVAVAAVGTDGKRSNFSSAHDYVDIAAPGGNYMPGILSTVPLLECKARTHAVTGSTYWDPSGCGIDSPPAECPDATTLDSNPFNEPTGCGHRVGYASGTSMASPFVAGVVAHMLNRYPEATPGQVRQALAESAQDRGDPGKDDEYGHGIVQPLAAIERLGEIIAESAVKNPRILVTPAQLDIDAGSSASYTVALASKPSGDVTVIVDAAVPAAAGVRVAPANLTFAQTNWQQPQTVTVTVPQRHLGASQPLPVSQTATAGGYDSAANVDVTLNVRADESAPTLASIEVHRQGLPGISPPIPLKPVFSPDITSYTVTVPEGLSYVTVDAMASAGSRLAVPSSPPDARPDNGGYQVSLSGPVGVPSSDRADKPGTSAAVGERFLEVVGDDWSGAVIVASSENFPDGLTAASLAGALRAPILLTPRDRLDPSVARFVRDNDVREIVIMGGTAAISDSVKRELDAIIADRGWSSRLWGQDRYRTALEIAERVVRDAGAVGDLCGTNQRSVFIATGRNSADALAASPAAYAAKMPVLLVDPRQRTLHSGVRDFIREHGIETAVILGGNAAVPERLQQQIQALGSINRVSRVAGPDRFATAAQLATQIVSKCYDAVETIGLANGRGFADALAAGPLTAELQGVMLLTGPDDVPPATLDAMTQIGKEAQLVNVTLALLAVGDIAQADNAVTEANNTAGRQLHGKPALGTVDSITAGGGGFSCAIRTDGTVQCWGWNNHDQSDPPTGRFAAVSAGGFHACGIRTNGTVECWGRNNHGQSDPPAGQFTAVTAGDNHSCGIRTNGAVACWGSNRRGETDPPTGQFITEPASQPDTDAPPLTDAVESISTAASDTQEDVHVWLTVTDPQRPGTTTRYQVIIRQE